MKLFDQSEYTIPNEAAAYFTEFQTPPAVCDYMRGLLPAEAWRVLEPTPGTGNLVRSLEKGGYQVTAPEDFFLLKKQWFDAVVMNPPFSEKFAFMKNAPAGTKGMRLGYRILLECMSLSNNVIALMPWFTISDSDVRLRHLKKYGLVSLTALPRSTFQYARIQTVVIELQKGWVGPTIFHVYEKK